MIGPGQYLCGCWPKDKLHYKVVRKDHRGVLCPEHGDPMYGYLSPTVATASGRDATDWGKMGTGHTVVIQNNPDIQDRRDNRSPEEAYAAYQREKAISGNGHQ